MENSTQPTLRGIVIGEKHAVKGVYGEERLARLAERVSMLSEPISPGEWPTARDRLGEVEVIFGTWSLPEFTAADAALLANLRAVFYAAGAVRYFAPPLLERGVEIFSAAAANAIPVAEFTLAQILLANKGYFRIVPVFTARNPVVPGRGNFGATVALLGAGEIGRVLIERLKPFHLEILVFDPFLSDEQAAGLGVEKVSLQDAFARGNVVSNHLADLPATKGLLCGHHFSSLPPYATFINTGRGATVREAELIETLRIRLDLTALLDVTHPEPPLQDSPLWTLPNVHLSPHIAGSLGDERGRMADWMIDEFDAWRAGRPVRHRITLERLERMA